MPEQTNKINPILERDDWFNGAGKTGNYEFQAFFQRFTIKLKSGGEAYAWRLKNEALQQSDQYYFNLPKMPYAIKRLCALVVNKGVTHDQEELEGNDLELWNGFLDSMLPSPIEFIKEIARLYFHKGNGLLNYIEGPDQKYYWTMLEPEKFSLYSSVEDEKLAKYFIQGFLYHKPKKGYEELDPKFCIYFKSSPSSVLGVPPLLFNNMMNKAIIADIKKFSATKVRGAYKKQLMTAWKIEGYNPDGTKRIKPLSKPEQAQLSKSISNLQTDPTKSTHITDVEVSTTDINPIEADPDFQNHYDDTYSLHTAALSGIAPYMLLKPNSVNRATMEQQYKEMIEMTVQPINNTMTGIIKKMFEIYIETNKLTKPKFTVNLQNPKPQLDVQLTGKDYQVASDNDVIDLDEHRNSMGFDKASPEQREKWETRKTTKTKPISNNNNTKE